MSQINTELHDFTTEDKFFENCKIIQGVLHNSQNQKQNFLCTVCSNCFAVARTSLDGQDMIDNNIGLYCLILRTRMDINDIGENATPIIECLSFVPRIEE